MKKKYIIFTFLILTFIMNNMSAQTKFYDLSYIDIQNKEIKMSTYSGKKILIVNTASKCGYTSQYEGLEKLFQTYKDKLVIIGFPCNQFGWQEPGTEAEIISFCTKNYGVQFNMASKIDVKGKNISPIYKWLTQKSLNNVLDASISWNFNKFLIDEKGNLLAYFGSNTKPLDESITNFLK